MIKLLHWRRLHRSNIRAMSFFYGTVGEFKEIEEL